MPPLITASYYLKVNDVPLATPAWRVTDLSALLEDALVDGNDRPISGANGWRGFPRVRTGSIRTFPLTVFGHYDHEGNAHANPRQGVITNRNYLKANLGIASTANAAGTVTAVWHQFDGTEVTAQVHVSPLKGWRRVSPTTYRTTFDLSIPLGDFA